MDEPTGTLGNVGHRAIVSDGNELMCLWKRLENQRKRAREGSSSARS